MITFFCARNNKLSHHAWLTNLSQCSSCSTAYRISSNRRHPWIVAVASTCTRMRIISDNNHHASARAVRVVRLVSTADRGMRSYWQRLTVVTVSLVHILSSHCWCLQAFQRNNRRPRIVAAQKQAVKRIAVAESDGRNTVVQKIGPKVGCRRSFARQHYSQLQRYLFIT